MWQSSTNYYSVFCFLSSVFFFIDLNHPKYYILNQPLKPQKEMFMLKVEQRIIRMLKRGFNGSRN